MINKMKGYFELLGGTRLGNLLQTGECKVEISDPQYFVRPSIMLESFDLLYDQTVRMTWLTDNQNAANIMSVGVKVFRCDGELKSVDYVK